MGLRLTAVHVCVIKHNNSFSAGCIHISQCVWGVYLFSSCVSEIEALSVISVTFSAFFLLTPHIMLGDDLDPSWFRVIMSRHKHTSLHFSTCVNAYSPSFKPSAIHLHLLTTLKVWGFIQCMHLKFAFYQLVRILISSSCSVTRCVWISQSKQSTDIFLHVYIYIFLSRFVVFEMCFF